MLEFLNQNAGALTVIFTAVVTLSTVVYAILTAVLVGETRRMRQAQTEPKVEMVIKPREEWVNLLHVYIRNIGLVPAYKIFFNVFVEKGGDGAQSLIHDFTKANFFKTGLTYLGPGQELVSGFSEMNDKFEQKIESVLVFDVFYRSATGKKYQEKFRFDFSAFKGHTQVGKPHFYSIAQNLEKIQKDFHNLAAGFKKFKVDVYNADDRDQERQRLDEHLKKLAVNNKNQNPSS